MAALLANLPSTTSWASITCHWRTIPFLEGNSVFIDTLLQLSAHCKIFSLRGLDDIVKSGYNFTHALFREARAVHGTIDSVSGKTFYIETFGCQMNAHDSEKVIGTLLAKGYTQVEQPADAALVLYNTCSIRDKAEQKVFNRLQNFKREAGKGKIFGVLGCVAQQEGEKIFDRAPHVSLVAGSASYPKLGEMLVQLEAGNRRVTGLNLDTEETFDTPFARRDNPHRAYITIIEGCDKSCAYCVVPFTRGPERSRSSNSVLAEAAVLAAQDYTEIQLLGQNVNSYRDPSSAGWDFAALL